MSRGDIVHERKVSGRTNFRGLQHRNHSSIWTSELHVSSCDFLLLHQRKGKHEDAYFIYVFAIICQHVCCQTERSVSSACDISPAS